MRHSGAPMLETPARKRLVSSQEHGMGERSWHVGSPASVRRSLRRSPCRMRASAQDYPTRTVKIIVPFPPGGTADAMPRIVAEYLTRKWGQPIIIENRAGAGGNVGADAAYQAEPDGYTLFASPPPPLVINQNLYAEAAVRSGAVHSARGDGQGAERDPDQLAEAEGRQNRRRLRRLRQGQSRRAQFRRRRASARRRI